MRAPSTRWSVASRILAGTLGAYGITALAITALSVLLARSGVDRVEAVTATTLASFLLLAIISMAAFHAHSVARCWAWLAGSALLCGLIWFLSGQ